jgi:hypothetical protein
VSPDATLVVEDADGTQVTLVNGDNVEMTVTEAPDGITIEGTADTDKNIVTTPIQGQEGGDGEFTESQGTVISSTGITCGNTDSDDTNGDDGANDGSNVNVASAGGVDLTCEQLIRLVEDDATAGQYITEISQRCEGSANVISETVPGKSLANTGGPLSGLLVMGLLLTGAGLFLRASLRR